ncbi:glycosyltransferase family 4 protein, partial [bacterium]|nr:glycosyltransferase family 4 protein [bacterium]
ASSVAGVPEAIDDGETGFLVEPGNVEQLQEKLRLLIQDSELRKKLGKNARIKYEKFFTFERMAKKTLGIYESVSLNRSI